MERINLENLLWGMAVLGALYLLFKYYKSRKANKPKCGTPVTLSEEVRLRKAQACERLLLLVHRSEFSSMLFRVIAPQMTVSDLQAALSQTLRSEWEYNAVQQLYVSDAVWNAIEEFIEAQRLQIHRQSLECSPDEQAQALATLLLADSELEQEMVKKAKQLIKQEMQLWMES